MFVKHMRRLVQNKMIEKIGLIKNPLTIIAIFAGIAEVSGTIVLPFISPTNQLLFIYFLIFFPSILVILFFITLYFNNRVLYAPSDYKDELNYIKIHKYDRSSQKEIEVKVLKGDTKNYQLNQVKEKVQYNQVPKLRGKYFKKEETIKSETNWFKSMDYEFLVSLFENANDFIINLRSSGIKFKIYQGEMDEKESFEFSSFEKHRAIWLSDEIDLKIAQWVIKKSKEFYPHLEYIKIIMDYHYPKQIYIGGSTDSAINMFKCIPLKDFDFEKLQSFTDISAFHKFINQFSKSVQDL